MMRGLARRVPVAAWLCVAVGALNGLAWSVITPPFQVPDEISHFAYAQYLAETGTPPRHVPGDYMSAEERLALERLRFFSIVGQVENRPIWTEAGQAALDAALADEPSRVSDGSSSAAVNNPPLFYALQTLPYTAASEGTILDRLATMRLLSVLLMALTVLATFLFLREVFPGSPWAWSVGALAVAFQPLFGFIASGVNNDSGLILMSSLMLLALARAFRRGLDIRSATAIGAVAGLGVVTKLTFLAFLPAVAFAVLLLVWRGRAKLGAALVAAGSAGLVAAVPVAAYLILNGRWDRQLMGGLVGGEAVVYREGHVGSLLEQLSYTWQLYLPRLPFQADLIPGVAPRSLWLDGLIGRFGWLDYGFERWVYDVGLVVVAGVAVLAVAGVVRERRQLRRRAAEAAVYGAFALGLLVVIADLGYAAFVSAPYPFEQARYLLPLLALGGCVVVMAARGAGRRLEPFVGALLVGVVAAHGFFAMLVTIGRYYG